MTDLHDVLSGAWARLYQSAEVRDAGFRISQLATISLTGAPQVRTVVVRGASFDERTVRVHTDIRSPKVAEIRANSAVSLVIYNHSAGEQIRLEGAAVAHHRDEVAEAAWRGAHPQSRVTYRTPFTPGASLSRADEADVTDEMRAPDDADAGFETFCAVVIAVRRLDWLDLATSGHRRAVFEWLGDEWRGEWVAP